jgi:hypothetical protein
LATLPIIAPRIYGYPGLDSPVIGSYFQQQAAAFREADFLALTTTGSITTPSGGLSTLATYAGPSLGQNVSISSTAATTANNVTITGVSTTGAPAATYYVQLTYTASGLESQTGTEFLVNCAAGYTFSVNVSATGAPSGTTNFAAYVATYSGGEALQQASKTTTATGSAFSISYPLTNSIGANRATTNASANIIGLAMADSAAQYVTGEGGSFTAGGPANLLGTWGNPAPLGPQDPQQTLVAKVGNGQPIEISLLQAWNNSLIGTSAGLLLTSAGYFVLDNTQSNKIITITDKIYGVPSDVGVAGDTYARVKAVFTSGTI